MAKMAVTGDDVVYGVFVDFLLRHKFPRQRFLVPSKLSLTRIPADEADWRKVIVDIGVVNFTLPGSEPPFRLRLGVDNQKSFGCHANVAISGDHYLESKRREGISCLLIPGPGPGEGSDQKVYFFRHRRLDRFDWGILDTSPLWTIHGGPVDRQSSKAIPKR